MQLRGTVIVVLLLNSTVLLDFATEKYSLDWNAARKYSSYIWNRKEHL